MKKSSIIYISLFIFLEIIKLIIIADYDRYDKKQRIEARLYEEKQVIYEQIESMKGYKILMPAVLSKKEGMIQHQKEMPVTIIGTNSYFQQVQPLQIMYGAFWKKGAVDNKSNVVVISEVLARQLYGTENAVGNTCKINDHYYQIVGVYKKYLMLADALTDDGKEQIYVPISSEEFRKTTISEIWIVAKGITPSELNQLGINTLNAHINNQSEALQDIKAVNHFPKVILGIILLAEALKGLIKQIRQRNLSVNHIKKTIFYALGIATGVFIISKTLNIPQRMLPATHILDIKAYSDYIKGTYREYNYIVKTYISRFTQGCYYIKHILWILGSVQIILLVGIKKSCTIARLKLYRGEQI